MCFSPTASFVSAAAIATIGVATLRHVREPRTFLFAATPMLFALHQFTEAGMIRVLAVESTKTYFDTNVSDHHHFFVEGHNEVLDIPISTLTIGNLPEPPNGMEIAHLDVVIRLRRKQR